MIHGRRDDLDWLRNVWSGVVDDGAAVAIVTGEAGLGKTSLIEAFLQDCEPAPKTLRAWCPADSFDPTETVDALLAAAGCGPLSSFAVVAEPGPLHHLGAFDESQRRRHRALGLAAEALIASTQLRPAIVLLDDIHWATPPVYDFLRLCVDVIERSRRHRVLLLGLARSAPPDHPLTGFLGDLERRTRVHRLELGSLDPDAIEDIVGERTAATPSRTFVDLVQRAARGSPLRALAAIQVLRQRGVPVDVGTADARTWASVRVPGALDDPVAAWVADVSRRAEGPLAAAAVLAREFTLADLEAMTDGRREELTRLVDDLVAARLLATDGAVFWFGHAQYRDCVYDGLSASTTGVLHERCLRHMASRAVSIADEVALGHHCLAAADLVPLDERVKHLERAGKAAMRLTMWADAARYLEAVLDLLGDDLTPDATVELHGLLGHAYYFGHDRAAAGRHLRAAVESAGRLQDERAWAASLAALIRLAISTDPELWRTTVEMGPVHEFLATAQGPAERSQVLQVLAEAQLVAGRYEDAEQSAGAAVTLARESGDPTVLAMAVYAQAFGDMAVMKIGRSLERTLQAMAYADEGDDWHVQGVMRARLPFPLFASGRLAAADDAAATSIADAAANHEYTNQALGHCTRASSALLRGDFVAVDRHAEAADRATRRSNYVMADLFLGPTVALSHLYRGDASAARRAVADWPNLPRSARGALTGLIDAHLNPFELGAESTPLRPGTGLNQVTAGFHAARIEAALLRGDEPSLRATAADLARWCEDGLEFPPSYPVSLARLRGEVLLCLGDTDRGEGELQTAVGRCLEAGAHVERARTLAAQARSAARAGAVDRTIMLTAAAVRLADEIGLSRQLLHLGDLLIESAAAAAHDDGPPQAVLITDVVGSTAVSHDLGDVAYVQLVLRHHDLVRAVLTRWAGREFSESGDGLLAWFDNIGEALLAAEEIQQIVKRTAFTGPRLEVKVGVAAGRLLFYGGRPYGLVVNRAARVLGFAAPGEVVVDQAVCAALPPLFTATPLREVELRGMGMHRIAAVRMAHTGATPVSE